MIIQCKECGTKYRFDKSQIDGEGIWVRCSRCEAVFFQENPLAEIASLIESMETGGETPGEINEEGAEEIGRMFSGAETEPKDDEPEARVVTADTDLGMLSEVETGDDEPEPEQEETSEAADEIIDDMETGGETPGEINEEGAEDIDGIFSEGETEDDTQKLEQGKTYADAGEVMDNEEVSEEETQKPRSSGKKIAIFLILVILIAGGIYLWTSPRAIKMISNKVLPRVEQIFGIKSSDTPDVGLHELGVDLINVKERFVKNWVAGDIMVVEGSAVNNNKCSVSNIKIRGKILDSSGNVLSEVESNCGNILTDDELKGLTEKEMMKELSNPYGREVSNAGIEPGTDIPFMLALIMPAGDASEFLVELAGIEIADNK